MNNPQTATRKLPTVLVTGANGQLGHKIRQLLSANCKLIMTDYKEMDITDSAKVLEVIEANNPDWIIHGAAYTKVDQAEDEVALCAKINADGTKNLAEVANKLDIPIIYISTDYVFDGKKSRQSAVSGRQTIAGDQRSSVSSNLQTANSKQQTGYVETDTAKPLNVYGETKLDGEKFIQKICKRYYILRVAWLFGELPKNYPGTNFIETMLRLSKERDALSVVNDQIGSPTYTKDLVEVIDKIVSGQQPAVGSESQSANRQPQTANQPSIPYGLYHFSGNGECSWYDFAKNIFRKANIGVDLKPTTSDQYPQKAKRPSYTYMSKEKIEKALKMSVRPWQEMVNEYLAVRSKGTE